jgi:hypothetical protein
MVQMKREVGAAGCLLATIVMAVPSGTHAAGEFVPEEGVVEPPGGTYQAVVADLDADGVGELVRLVDLPRPSQALAVEIWTEADHGWQPVGEPVLLRRQPDPSEAAAYDPHLVDAAGRLRVATPDGTRLLVIRSGTSERVIVATSVTVGRRCCLSLLAVELSAGGPRVVPLADRLPAADTALALDADGDGSDELLTRDAPIRSRDLRDQQLDGTPLRRLRLYRLDERSVSELAVGAPPIRTQTPFVLGESDGLPGQEAGMIDPAGSGSLARVSWDGSRPLTVERTGLFEPSGPGLEVMGAAGLPGAMLVAGNGSQTQVAHWPAGSRPRWTSAQGGGQLLGVLGGLDQPRIVLRDANTGGLSFLDAQMRAVEPPAAGGMAEAVDWLPPYAGPLPGGVHDGPAIVVDGQLLAAERGTLGIRPVANLAATYPVGLAGRDGRWLVLLRDPETGGRERAGGRLWSLLELGAASLSIVPAAEVLAPQPAVPEEQWLRFEDSVGIPSAGQTPTRAVAAGGYAARLDVPRGSLVLAGGAEEGEAVSTATGDDLRIRFPSTRGGPPPQLVVVTPAGRSYRAAWRVGRVVGAAPSLSASGSAAFLIGEAHVRGSTARGALLSVDGRPVPIGADGAFSARVRAGLWPRSVSVIASDVLGQTRTTTLTVVGYLDYPRLPWLPIVTLSLLALAGLAAWRQRPGGTSLRADALVEVEPMAAASALMDGRLPDGLQPRDSGRPDDRSEG